jgi:uncharacterized protein
MAQGRITVIDSLRGFALLGILLVHATGRFFMNPGHGSSSVMLDRLLAEIMSGKFNTIFNMLFGVSFYIMLSRAEAKGVDFRCRFEWRLVILILIGYFHRLILPHEALLPYGVMGLALILFWKFSKNRVLAIAVACLLIHPFAAGIVHHLTPAPSGPGNAVHVSFSSAISYFQYNAQQLRNPVAVFLDADWFFKIFGLFLLGFYLAGAGFFENIESKRNLYLKTAGIALVLYLIFRIGSRYTVKELYVYSHYCLSAVMVCGFILLYSTQAKNILKYMEPYGKMGLTNYIMQSVFGLLVFAPFFLGLNHLNTISNIFIALVIYSLQIMASVWWLRRFAYGPFEWLWRSATYLKRIPIRKNLIIDKRK